MLNEIKSLRPPSNLKKSSLLSAAFMAALLASCGKSNEASPQSIAPVEASIAAPIKSVLISAGELKGQFITAGEKTPVVIIVPGSGPTDLDGNNPMGVSANSYKMLAEVPMPSRLTYMPKITAIGQRPLKRKRGRNVFTSLVIQRAG